MHVGIVTAAPLPACEGIGSYVWNLAIYLKEMGHQVTIIKRGSYRRTSHRTLDGIDIWSATFLPIDPIHVHWHLTFSTTSVTNRPKIVTVHTPMKPNIRSIKEKDRPLIDDLDTVPFPDRDLINASDYTGSALRKGIPDTEVIITSGCPSQ